jgi:hypothetical protein
MSDVTGRIELESMNYEVGKEYPLRNEFRELIGFAVFRADGLVDCTITDPAVKERIKDTGGYSIS